MYKDSTHMEIRSKNAAGTHGSSPTAHLASIEFKDFKSLKRVTVDLGQVNVFVGANGAGKSCLLEAIGILGACAGGAVDDQALLRRGVRPGVPELYKSSFGEEKMAPKISLRASSTEAVTYHAFITNPAGGVGTYWKFGNESLEQDGEGIASRGPKGNANALGLAMPLENTRSVTTFVRASQKTAPTVRQFLSVLEDFAIFAPVTPVLRGIAPDPSPRTPVGLYGGQLAEAVGLMKSQHRHQKVFAEALSLIDWAREMDTGEPSRRFLSPSVPTSSYVIQFQDRHMAERRNTLSGYDASEGALYILFMLVLAANGPSVLAVDNFDQALNPRTARALTRVFTEHALSNGKQVLLTTHNPLVLDGLDLGDDRVRLYSVSRDRNGHSLVRRVPVKDFKALKKKHGDFAVSRLWIEGRLGGMPDNV
jgi:predicted ATPase